MGDWCADSRSQRKMHNERQLLPIELEYCQSLRVYCTSYSGKDTCGFESVLIKVSPCVGCHPKTFPHAGGCPLLRGHAPRLHLSCWALINSPPRFMSWNIHDLMKSIGTMLRRRPLQSLVFLGLCKWLRSLLFIQWLSEQLKWKMPDGHFRNVLRYSLGSWVTWSFRLWWSIWWYKI